MFSFVVEQISTLISAWWLLLMVPVCWVSLMPRSFVCVSFSEVFGEEGCVPGAGGGPRGGLRSGQPARRLSVTDAEDSSCSLAAHHHHHHNGLLSTLWPQCCKMMQFFHFRVKYFRLSKLFSSFAFMGFHFLSCIDFLWKLLSGNFNSNQSKL